MIIRPYDIEQEMYDEVEQVMYDVKEKNRLNDESFNKIVLTILSELTQAHTKRKRGE